MIRRSLLDRSRIEQLLPRVSKPSRYLGNEWNSVHKDPQTVRVRVALAYPDLYEVGMSHLGLAILYDVLNRRPDVWAERVYAPAHDMELQMRASSIPLFALESGDAVRDLDLLGFTLPYEMTASNLLNMLDLAGLPLLASERGEGFPLVIAGGVGVMNPEPLTDFVDAFLVGDGEEAIQEIVDAVATGKDRAERLRLLGQIEGMYIPSRYEVRYHPDGTIAGVEPLVPAHRTVERRIIHDLDAAPYPTAPVVPHIAAIHDRFTLEIMRGCPRACRFCQARGAYSPPRWRSIEKLVSLAVEGIRNTGYDEVSLLALSAGDYPRLGDLIQKLSQSLTPEHVAIALPSLYADSMRDHVPAQVKKGDVRKNASTPGGGCALRGGFTFAPETGSPRMRKVINKHIDDEVLLDTVRTLFQTGHRQVKLYLMVGLPGETEEDLECSAGLVRKVLETAGGRQGVNVSVSSFVPKPHTPFEREAMAPREVLRERQGALKRKLKSRRVKLRWHDVDTSFLEAAFARGDRRLGAVLLRAWEKGARFDAWSEHFRFELWMDSFRECGLDPHFYACRSRPPHELLPWAHVGRKEKG